MKYLFLAVILGFYAKANAAVGDLVYESAASSITVNSVSLSSSTPTLISKAPSTSKSSLSNLPISWYSITLFNVSASTAAYAFSSSSYTAPSPALTCSSGVPLGAGTEASPWNQTEQFFGFFMWGISCATNAALDIKAVYRGR